MKFINFLIKPMTTKELMPFIGREGYISATSGKKDATTATIAVRVVDAKYKYGTLRLQITPKEGTGTWWVQEHKIDFIN